MILGQETFRKLIGKSEIGLPTFSPEVRLQTIRKAKAFVQEVRQIRPDAGVDVREFSAWMPGPGDFSRPHRMGENVHTQHNIRHVGAVLAESMFLIPFVESVYQDSLPRPLFVNAVNAAAASHDLLRNWDIRGSVPDWWYKRHGEKMADRIRSGEKYPQLSSNEKTIAASAVQFHDVDPRKPEDRLPEDELLAIVDRGELTRILYGIGPMAMGARGLKRLVGVNPFEQRMTSYTSHYFPDLLEKTQPLSQAMLIVSIEGIKKGLGQKDSVIFAMQELGMVKDAVQ